MRQENPDVSHLSVTRLGFPVSLKCDRLALLNPACPSYVKENVISLVDVNVGRIDVRH